MDVGIVLHLGPGEQVGRDPAGEPEVSVVERRWRRWPEVHHLGAGLAGAMNYGLTDAAEPTIPWLDRGEG